MLLPRKSYVLSHLGESFGHNRRKCLLSATICKEIRSSMNFHWSPFPIEITGVSANMPPSSGSKLLVLRNPGVSANMPTSSGSKLLVLRNPENESPTRFEFWSQWQVEKEFHIPHSVHGSVYIDGWFEGISWNSDKTLIAYVAEESSPSKPTFNSSGYKKGSPSTDKDDSSWKGQGQGGRIGDRTMQEKVNLHSL